MYHLTLEIAMKSPGLVEYLHSVFAQVVEDGRTYPMEVAEGETYSRQAFERYFFAADVIVGILVGEGGGDGFSIERHREVEIVSGTDSQLASSILSKDGHPSVWEDVVVGFYYVRRFAQPCSPMKGATDALRILNQVKPNYPGRSSHVRHQLTFAPSQAFWF